MTHHSSEEYNLSTALRQGAIQNFVSFSFYIPLAIFIPVPLFIVHKQINTIYQFWIHTKLIKKLPFGLEYVLNTPSHHRIHHAVNIKYLDKNYGGTLIIFDRIFGTFVEEEEEPIYGISTKLDTWNIFVHQFYQFYEIYLVFLKTNGILNKFRVLLDFGPFYNFKVKNILQKKRY
jgi:alkylglycerol monooxygenase